MSDLENTNTPLQMNILKLFEGFKLEVDLAVPEGITAIFGPSGSGKTTLLDLIAGVQTPDRGIIQMNGEEIFNASEKKNLAPNKRGIGYVFQDDALFPHMTVQQNLAFSGQTQKNTPTWQHIIELMGLGDLMDRYPGTLSGGEKKRVAIARVLLSGPGIFMLDEPLANIDAARREAFFPYLEMVRKELSVPIIYVSHQVDEVIRLADNLVLLDHGKITAAGPVADIYDTPLFQASLGAAGNSTLFSAKVSGYVNGVAALEFGGGTLYSADDRYEAGDEVRVRIMARDVAISTLRPDKISILNVLPCKLKGIDKTFHGHAGLTMEIEGGEIEGDGEEKLLIKAEITPKSVRELKLEPDMRVYALVKALALISPAV